MLVRQAVLLVIIMITNHRVAGESDGSDGSDRIGEIISRLIKIEVRMFFSNFQY